MSNVEFELKKKDELVQIAVDNGLVRSKHKGRELSKFALIQMLDNWAASKVDPEQVSHVAEELVTEAIDKAHGEPSPPAPNEFWEGLDVSKENPKADHDIHQTPEEKETADQKLVQDKIEADKHNEKIKQNLIDKYGVERVKENGEVDLGNSMYGRRMTPEEAARAEAGEPAADATKYDGYGSMSEEDMTPAAIELINKISRIGEEK